jgi:hypothetical protein
MYDSGPRRLHAGRCPRTCQSRIVASLARRRDRPTFSVERALRSGFLRRLALPLEFTDELGRELSEETL